jgi:hypothetical protein
MDGNMKERLEWYMEGFELDRMEDIEGEPTEPLYWGCPLNDNQDGDLIDLMYIAQNPLNAGYFYITQDGAAQLGRYAYSPFDGEDGE